MSLIKVFIFCCLLITGFIYSHIYSLGIERDKAYNRGYEDGMAAISPDYCLKEFSGNSTKKFRYIQRQYCKGIQK